MDFPAPEAPSKTLNSPHLKRKDVGCRATTLPGYLTDMSISSITATTSSSFSSDSNFESRLGAVMKNF